MKQQHWFVAVAAMACLLPLWASAAELSCSVTFDQNPLTGQSTTMHWSSSGATLFYINNVGYVGASGAAQIYAAGDYSGTVSGGSAGNQLSSYEVDIIAKHGGYSQGQCFDDTFSHDISSTAQYVVLDATTAISGDASWGARNCEISHQGGSISRAQVYIKDKNGHIFYQSPSTVDCGTQYDSINDGIGWYEDLYRWSDAPRRVDLDPAGAPYTIETQGSGCNGTSADALITVAGVQVTEYSAQVATCSAILQSSNNLCQAGSGSGSGGDSESEQTDSQTFTTAGEHSFTVPSSYTSLSVEVWGGGGGGAAPGNYGPGSNGQDGTGSSFVGVSASGGTGGITAQCPYLGCHFYSGVAGTGSGGDTNETGTHYPAALDQMYGGSAPHGGAGGYGGALWSQGSSPGGNGSAPGGGGGGGWWPYGAAGGGSGGGYSKKTYGSGTLTPNSSINFTVGAGGEPGTGSISAGAGAPGAVSISWTYIGSGSGSSGSGGSGSSGSSTWTCSSDGNLRNSCNQTQTCQYGCSMETNQCNSHCVASYACNVAGTKVINVCDNSTVTDCSAEGQSCVAGACVSPILSVQSFAASSPLGSFSATGHLQVVPSLVARGTTSHLYWNAINAASCTISGDNGDSWTGIFSGSSGKISAPITDRTIFTLTCTAVHGATPASLQESATVNVLPSFQEL